MSAPERGRGGRRAPRKLGGALERLVADDAPQTLLAEVQAAWPRACGETIAARSEPVSERNGTITIACESGPWAQELELMGDLLRERIDAIVGADRVLGVRFTADLARHR
jgi:predicted nucleic acid-binding Zn ribbon protein